MLPSISESSPKEDDAKDAGWIDTGVKTDSTVDEWEFKSEGKRREAGGCIRSGDGVMGGVGV